MSGLAISNHLYVYISQHDCRLKNTLLRIKYPLWSPVDILYFFLSVFQFSTLVDILNNTSGFFKQHKQHFLTIKFEKMVASFSSTEFIAVLKYIFGIFQKWIVVDLNLAQKKQKCVFWSFYCYRERHSILHFCCLFFK